MDLSKILGDTLDPNRLKELLEVVAKNQQMIVNLPQLLYTLAAGLTEAGANARAAGVALMGEDGRSGALSHLGSSAKTLGGLADGLTSVADLVDNVSDEIGKVPLMGLPAAQLGKAAQTIGGTTGALGGIADDLVALADVMAEVGATLAALGDALDSSGARAKTLVELPKKEKPAKK